MPHSTSQQIHTTIELKFDLMPYLHQINRSSRSGVIRSYQREAGTWSYLVEMELGPEPDFGRIGAEATVIMSEGDLDAV